MPIILSKLAVLVTSSFSAEINLASAPANDASDCAKSVKLISPLSNRAWSVSTCLSNKSTLILLMFNFFLPNIKSVCASAASSKVSCSVFFNFICDN